MSKWWSARLVAVAAVAVGLLSVDSALVAAPGGASSQAFAAEADGQPVHTSLSVRQRLQPAPRQRAQLIVVFHGPVGVLGGITLVGPQRLTASKPAAGKRDVVTIPLKPGTYAVRPLASVSAGKTYVARPSVTHIRVSTAAPTRISVRLVRQRQVTDLIATQVTTSSVSLQWRLPKRQVGRVILRRAKGDVPPRTSRSGSQVKIGGGSAVTDKGLDPDTTYSYSLFTTTAGQVGRPRPVSLTLGTSSPSAAAFVEKPTAVVVSPANHPVVTVGANADVSVTLGSGPPVVLGAAVVLPTSQDLPGGYVGVVNGVSSDGKTYALSPGSFTDVFDFLDTSLDLSGPEQTEALPRRGPQPGSAHRSSRYRAWPRHPHQGTASKFTCNQASGTIDLSNVQVGVQPSGHLDLDITSRWHIPVSVHVDAAISPTITIGADIDASVSGKCAVDLGKIVKTFKVGPVPLALVVDPELSVSGTLTAHLPNAQFSTTIGARDTANFGAGGDSNTGGAIFQTAAPQLGSSANVSATIGITANVDLTFGLGAGAKNAGAVAGISGYIDFVQADLTGNTSGCVSLDAKSDAGLRLEAKAWAGPLAGNVTYQIPGWEISKHWAGAPWSYPSGCDRASGPPVIITTTLPSGQLGTPYTTDLTTADHRPGTWAVTSGGLPPGLALSGFTISGTPTTAGDFPFTLTFTDTNGLTDTAQTDIQVSGAGGGVWIPTVLPLPADAAPGSSIDVTQTACAADGSCLVVGDYRRASDSATTLGFWHYASGSWTASAAPQPPGQNVGSSQWMDISCGSASVCGVVATSLFQAQSVLWVLANGQWSVQMEPPVSSYSGSGALIACSQSGTCVAQFQGALLGFDGHTWSTNPSPYPTSVTSPDGFAGTGLACASDGSCTILGFYGSLSPAGPTIQPTLWTFRAGNWSQTDLVLPAGTDPTGLNFSSSLACSRHAECLADGQYASQNANSEFSFWTVPSAPTSPWIDSMADGGHGSPGGETVITCGDTICVAVIPRYDPQNGLIAEYLATMDSNGNWTVPAPALSPTPDELTGIAASCDESDDCVVTSLYKNRSTGSGRLIAFARTAASGWIAHDLTPDVGSSLADYAIYPSSSCGGPGSCVVAFTVLLPRATYYEDVSWIWDGNSFTPSNYAMPSGGSTSTPFGFHFACGGAAQCVASAWDAAQQSSAVWLLSGG